MVSRRNGHGPDHDEHGNFAPGNSYVFKPGQSGNPSGRPKGIRSMASKYRRFLAEHPEELEALMSATLRDKDAAAAFAQIARVHDGKDGGLALDAEADALEEKLREEREGPAGNRKQMEVLQQSLAALRTAGLNRSAQAVQEELLELRRREDEERFGPT